MSRTYGSRAGGFLSVLIVLIFVPIGLALSLCYVYALWADVKAGSFFRFALDSSIFPIGLIHGLWLAVTRLL